MDVLIGTILSQNTSRANSAAGLGRLRERFGSWDELADAPVPAIEQCIRVSGLWKTKAPRIRRLLRQIRRDRGRIDLEFLRRLPPGGAYDYLVQFDGIGPKTALCVLLFALGKRVFPVDTHVYRLTRRLGLLPEGVPAARAHEVLTPRIPPADRYALHVLLIAHGRRVCRPQRPRCRDCVLLQLCSFGQRRTRRYFSARA